MESDDENDLGGLNPTTPIVPIRTKKARTTKPNSRVESSKLAKGRKNAPYTLTDNSDIEEMVTAANPFDFSKHVEEDEQPPAPQARSRRAGLAPVANGRTDTKGKNKAKVPQKKTVSKKQALEPMDVDPIEVPDETEDEPLRRPQSTAKLNGRAKPTAARRETTDEVSKLKAQLERAQGQISTLSVQLEQFRLHHEASEKLYQQQLAQSDRQLQAHEDVIKELNIVLGKKLPLMRSVDSPVLDLLTREDVDEEKRAAEQEVQRYKAVAEQKQQEIDWHKHELKQRDDRILQMERAGTARFVFTDPNLRAELSAEIQRSATLAKASRAPPSVTRGGRPAGIDDPKHAEVVRFYEDVTNLILPGMKSAPGEHLGLEDWILTCIYTFADDDDKDAILKSLNFNLRLFHDVPSDHGDAPITSKDQLIPTVHYTPRELDRESPDFVDKLDFLKEPFSFPRSQLPLFLRTIYTKISDALKEEDSDDDESVQEIERM
ncbi:hypothetical protein H0H87_005138 [Tephrocybe sp. NHM501043]|nr:hypothetical protein H0H87_005138 [Tephrocybe sp. NHM501043]